ncbi:hypothetical protein [Bacillus sp. Marseille-P3800]|uniref:hypothetical protein n=1 Tax=Bacillus sp. Marseille-P3800 TaxID=2014782 RepID=UPI000C072FCF|nr:hypothetical protein [Bacillus sp. Marseille-P3800]
MKIGSIFQSMFPELAKLFTIFWLILTGILMSGYVITTLTSTQVFLFVWPIFLFWIGSVSFNIIKHDFHYALKLGATRKQFMLASMLLVLVFIGMGAVVHHSLIQLLPWVASIVGMEQVLLLGFAEFLPALSLSFVLVYELTAVLFVAILLFFIASVRQCFGTKAVYFFLAGVGVLFLIPFVQEAMITYVTTLHQGEALFTIYWFILPIMGLLAASHSLLKRTSLR